MDADIIIIGSGMGGATLAHGLAGTGRKVLILERGERLADSPEARDAEAIFGRSHFKSDERWLDHQGREFHPGNYYVAGGNTKFYGAVLLRYRAEDFAPLKHLEGTTPGWPFGYEELERHYTAAEQLYQVRGALGHDPTEPPHSAPYPHPPVPDEPSVADLARRLRAQGLKVGPVPLAVDIDAWLKRAPTTWDAFPDTTGAKKDAEGVLNHALLHPNVTLRTGARVTRLLAEGGRVTGVQVGAETLRAPIVCLCAGAVQSAVLLLESGLANGSDQLGRNFMNHNISAVVAYSPLRRNTSVYEKTIGFNDWYLTGGPGGAPLGNVQMLGRITGPIMAAEAGLPRWFAGHYADHSMHMMTMSEDLPQPDSRVLWRNGRIVLQWRRSNFRAHQILTARLKSALRRAGWPLVLSKTYEKKLPSHQCGTARMGVDPATSVVTPDLRAHDLSNLYIVDASVLPTSAAVNPSLTIAALALRAAAHIGGLS